jgi:hypothetical protein
MIRSLLSVPGQDPAIPMQNGPSAAGPSNRSHPAVVLQAIQADWRDRLAGDLPDL